MPIENTAGGTMITGTAIKLYRLMTLRSGLGLELKGMRLCRGRSCYAIVKAELGFKGNKQKVYDQLCAHIEAVGPGLAKG